MKDQRSFTISEVQADQNMIKTINRVFHDFDADTYEQEHPEIYDLERISWKKLMEGPLASIIKKQDAVILDIGTGNGFVINVISPFLEQTHTVIFSDISQKMIDSVRNTFQGFSFQKEYVVCEASHIPRPDASVDLITVNSVLHHIPDHQEFLVEARRLLRSGGALVIKHEPNIRFPRNLLLRTFFLLLSTITRRRTKGETKPVDQSLLDALAQEGVVFHEPITKQQLQSLVDIASPTASGGMDIERGFDPYEIVSVVFPNATTAQIQTYSFFGGKFNEEKNSITRFVSWFFRTLFPKDGYLFDLIVIK